MTENQSNTLVVVHLSDGRTLRRRSSNIELDARRVTLTGEGGALEEIDFDGLKAIFFVNEGPLLSGESEAAAHPGTILVVEFQDGETIRGTSTEYVPGCSGFHLYPLDRSKNEKIFIVNTALASIEVEKF